MIALFSTLIFVASLIAVASIWKRHLGARGRDGTRRVGFVGWVVALIAASAISQTARNVGAIAVGHLDPGSHAAEIFHAGGDDDDDRDGWRWLSHWRGHHDSDAHMGSPRARSLPGSGVLHAHESDSDASEEADDAPSGSPDRNAAALDALDRRIARNVQRRERLSARLDTLRDARDMPFEDAQDDPEIATALADLAALDAALERDRTARAERALELEARPR